MKNHLKYLFSLFVALVVMAGDGVLYSQASSPEYYQSSFVVSRKEIDLKNLRVYVFNQVKRAGKTVFPILLIDFRLKEVLNSQIRIVFQLHKNLHQNIASFINQSVFINEISTSSNFKKSLYTA
ncbi:hypothetical protein K6T82_21380 [Flavobacterium sp. 17A]|uniref:Uncharacterized protein n=1 Tax=Flavobacterium potami TaxID=2872310 RepID=A0A9X1KU95_9FLAO|nr:hypothetical protein [Flavobacterium potami]MBZ4037326.1 hypothetical protein [Flavobacterium potami]